MKVTEAPTQSFKGVAIRDSYVRRSPEHAGAFPSPFTQHIVSNPRFSIDLSPATQYPGGGPI